MEIALEAWPKKRLARVPLAHMQTTKSKPVSKEIVYRFTSCTCSAQEIRLGAFLMKRQASVKQLPTEFVFLSETTSRHLNFG